jgi:hypothetical protein
MLRKASVGLFVVVAACGGFGAQSAGAPVYPLKLSENHRYLVDQNGTAFLMVGDTP